MRRFSATIGDYRGAVAVDAAWELPQSRIWLSVQRSFPNAGSTVSGSDDLVIGAFRCARPFDLLRDRGRGVEKLRIRSGEVYAIPPGCKRFVSWTGHFDFRCVAVPSAWLARFDGQRLGDDPARLERLYDMVSTDRSAGFVLDRIADAMSAADEFYVEHAVGFLLATLTRAERRVQPGGGGLAGWRERRAVLLLERRLSEPVSLTEIAGELGLSPHHFARAFKASFGVSPYAWLTARRLALGAELLETTRLPVSDIAARCGFRSQSRFGTVFRDRFGQTPAAWRAQRRMTGG